MQGHTGKKDYKRSLRPGRTVKAFLLYFSCESPFPCSLKNKIKMSTLTSKQRKDQTGWFWNYPAVSWHKIGKAFEEIRKGEILWDTVWVRDTIKIAFVGSEQAYVLLMALSWPPLVQLKVFSALWGLSMNEGGNRTGSILKAGLHLGPDCGLWAICPVSMETTYQLENQAPPGRKSPRALWSLKEYPNYLCNRIESYILLCLLGYDHRPIDNCPLLSTSA